ncbi:hypothetical protein [Oleiagrimonas soli]|uniref:Glycosyl hydrolase family 32 N-terminal domain-containing protein n=1 Tax=Oleiagrimonas soli TaxID=1543381 RepID=A0A841KE90_9GAMM|nr:hypothetical protein [Oleiagrimonas soli]MBB6183512.1 hypothetical protein [Oleiagrimonas soli]
MNSAIRSLFWAICAFAVLTGVAFGKTTYGGQVVGLSNVYNYSPSVIESNGVQKFWWCAQAINPNNPSQYTDTIQYVAIDVSTQTIVQGPKTVLAETPAAWDSAFTCNPRVVEGVFTNPFGNGLNYTYAMYYVGTSQSSGTLNSIGVAFSNDGVSWVKYPQPVIMYTSQDAQNNAYGMGQPAAYNHDGKAGIWLLYEHGAHHYKATSTDGVYFTVTGEITENGLDEVGTMGQSSYHSPTWGDAGYDYKTGYWYAAFDTSTRPPSTVGGVTERGQIGVVVYRIPNSSLLTGTTSWEQVSTIDTSLTGAESNFLASFLHDIYGNVNAGGYPQIELYVSTSLPRPAWNSTSSQRGQSGGTSHWKIAWSIWTPNSSKLALERYAYGSTYEVTTGYVDTSIFKLDKTLGYLYETPQSGANTPLYSCVAGSTDYFVSPSSNCESQTYLGLVGYAYGSASAASNLVPLYRCYTGSHHLVSTSSTCEGYTREGVLGYAMATQ